MFDTKIIKHFISFLFLFLLFNCSDTTGPSEDVTGKEIMPLALGNRWDYKISIYHSIDSLDRVEFTSSTVTKDTTIDSCKWYSFVPEANFWHANRPDGLWEYISADVMTNLERDTILLVLKYPTYPGEKYKIFSTNVEVLSTNAEVTVPAGTFKCVHIRHTDSTWATPLLHYSDSYYKPDVGRIKRVQVGLTSDNKEYLVLKEELISYSLN